MCRFPVTVVGHGPSAHGAGLGKKIDAGAVIRMHDVDWQDPEDYGRRSDYTVMAGPWAVRSLEPYQKAPAVAWLAYSFNPNPEHLHSEHLGRPVRWFHPRWFLERLLPMISSEVVHPVPTRGVAAVLMAIELGFNPIQLLGFDSILLGKIVQYPPGPARRVEDRYLGARCNRRHDYEAERRTLFECAREKGIEMIRLGPRPSLPASAISESAAY